LSKYVKKEFENNKKENIIILTSSHDTNNNFVTLVNQQVFDNEATILSFNKNRGEANFYDPKSFESFDMENTKIFFVDDSIASSNTLKYFYQLLYSTPNIVNTSNVGFDGIIVMLDLTSRYDEIILSHYIKKINDKTNFFTFAIFNVKPIKTDVEECFSCKRKQQYVDLIDRSALELTIFQVARRAYKLKEVHYRQVKSSKDKSIEEKFKTYLKAMATHYIYQNYVDEKYDVADNFDDVLKQFSEKVYNDIKKEDFFKGKTYNQELLKKIIIFQSEIALLKALSFPKLSYHYSIRKWAFKVVVEKIDQEVKKIESKEFELIYLFEKEIEVLELEEDNFLKYYKSMTNLNLINTYFAILGYFKDSKILNIDYTRLYYKIIQNKEIRSMGGSLLHVYPFAVKFAIADNLEKANYFEENLNEMFKEIDLENIKKYTLMQALKIENMLYWKNFVEKRIDLDIEDKIIELKKETELNIKIDKLKNLFELIFQTDKIHMFVSPYIGMNFKDYKTYLNQSENKLVNILDSFKNITNYPTNMKKDVQKIFYGAIDVEKDPDKKVNLEKMDKDDLKNKIDDTWANLYTDKYVVVRLISINTNLLFEQESDIKDNNPIWFKPIGCIVIEKELSYKEYIEIVRMVLSFKKYIINFLEKEFNYNVIDEIITKIEEEIATYSNMLTKINHSVYEYIDIGEKIGLFLEQYHANDECKLYLERMKSYSWGLMQLTKLHKIEKIKEEQTTVNEIFYLHKRGEKIEKEYRKKLYDFVKNCKSFSDNFCKDCELEINDDSRCVLNIDENSIEIIIFELVFNALKRMKKEEKPKITIQLKKNEIIIFNKILDKKEGKIHKERFDNAIQNSNERMGISTINTALLKCGYRLSANYIDTTFQVLIRKKDIK